MAATGQDHFKRNFVLGVVTGAFVNVGMAFVDPVTVLPVFVTKLGGSTVLVGLVSAMHGVGWFMPQVFASRLASTRARLIDIYRGFSVVRFLGLAGLAVTVYVVDVGRSPLMLISFGAMLLIAHLAGGFSAIPFLEITSRTIPVRSRGLFFGTRRLLGGVFGVVAGMLVGIVLDTGSDRLWMAGPVLKRLEALAQGAGLVGLPFPHDFGVLFILAGVSFSLGMLAFSFAGEASSRGPISRSSLADHLREGADHFRKDANYRLFLLLRMCWQLTAMGFPFYVHYAYEELGVPVRAVGLFLSVWVASGVLSNTLWGRALDVSGNRIVLLTTAILSALPPLCILILDRVVASTSIDLPLLLGALCAVFLLNGAIRSGRIISDITYLLESSPEERRPQYVGFMNSVSFPLMLSPVLGGLILELLGVRMLFALCGAFAVLNAALTPRLREPRHSPDDRREVTTAELS